MLSNNKILQQIINDYPDVAFISSDHFAWDPINNEIRYDSSRLDIKNFIDALIHEIGHYRLGHTKYIHDFELVDMELGAWIEARNVAKKYSVVICLDYMEDCLDSYRNWLYRRSLCPNCNIVGLCLPIHSYECLNCHMSWSVPAKQLCRIRRTKLIKT